MKEIIIDGKRAALAPHKRYRGAGMVSANNSSRLLLDYKYEHPQAYWEILRYIFGKDGIAINHLKIEMGSDVNSSSGTEPCVMRAADEEPDVTRGAGYQLAADAKLINPELTLDMLYWSEPRWVTDAEDVYAARYQWHKRTLDAAYETYGLKFDYISAVRNEREIDSEWIKYLSKSLKVEKDCPYDYAEIKLVAADEENRWTIADLMLADAELLEAVDVIGSHYTSWSTDNVRKLCNEYGKEIWFSEASAPMSYVKGIRRFEQTGLGLNDMNGVLDIATRIITMYPGGDMTLYEYQPVVSAYYDGVTYCHKQLITAAEPWSGHYLLDSGFYMSLHFSQFMKQGWAFVEGACAGDGVPGGDGHVVVDAVYNYMTVMNPESGDYSIVITNTTAEPIEYSFRVKNLAKKNDAVHIWETRGNATEAYDAYYFKNVDKILPKEVDGESTYTVMVKPYSMITISTVELEEKKSWKYAGQPSVVLELPYTDDFTYKGYEGNYVADRGGAPRYMTDEGGAFEVQKVDGKNVLMQMITEDKKADEWGYTPNPTTNFGDDRWYNYRASAVAYLQKSNAPEANYVGIGVRYILADSGMSGYWIQLYENGVWKLNANKETVMNGALDSVAMGDGASYELAVEAVNATVRAYINGALVCEYDAKEKGAAVLGAGRAALYSAYHRNYFEQLAITPLEGVKAEIERYDDTDEVFTYEGEWKHVTMSSFRDYRRTLSVGSKGAVCRFCFNGTGFGLMGKNEEGSVAITIDGRCVEEAYKLSAAGNREHFYLVTGLAEGAHEVELRVLEGKVCVDGVEVL